MKKPKIRIYGSNIETEGEVADKQVFNLSLQLREVCKFRKTKIDEEISAIHLLYFFILLLKVGSWWVNSRGAWIVCKTFSFIHLIHSARHSHTHSVAYRRLTGRRRNTKRGFSFTQRQQRKWVKEIGRKTFNVFPSIRLTTQSTYYFCSSIDSVNMKEWMKLSETKLQNTDRMKFYVFIYTVVWRCVYLLYVDAKLS